MRNFALLVAFGLVGCIASDPDGPPGGGSGSGSGSGSNAHAIDPTKARPCDWSKILHGTTAPNTFSAAASNYDTAGQLYCFNLDATQNGLEAHLMAETDQEPGAASSFQLALFAQDKNMLKLGWDVSIGESSTSTFANLEYSVPAGQTLPVALYVGAKAGSASTSVSVSLFEPYE